MWQGLADFGKHNHFTVGKLFNEGNKERGGRLTKEIVTPIFQFGTSRFLRDPGQRRERLSRRGVAAGTSLVSDAGELLNTRHAIDDMLETTQGTNAGNALQTARQAVDDELRASVPGIKEVDAKYAELARQKTAVQRGQTVLSDGRESPRPNELADEVRQGALPQGMQIGPSAVPLRLRKGARAEIERIVGTNVTGRVALQRLIKGEGDWNRARLSTLFGQDKTNAIIDLLDRERAFAETSNQVTKNSYTAAREAAKKDLTASDPNLGFGVPQAYMAGGVMGATREGFATKLGVVFTAMCV
ncbi:hypothetical protein [Mesorhizobium loti]|uniref:hypothetical protein n=1 Tax=Rhizobium loti TaxID=381 RepID=UPI0006853E59|nr:hypothetical protein [Mesorhizobium loti]